MIYGNFVNPTELFWLTGCFGFSLTYAIFKIAVDDAFASLKPSADFSWWILLPDKAVDWNFLWFRKREITRHTAWSFRFALVLGSEFVQR